MIQILNTLTPIFAVILLGFILGKKQFLTEPFLQQLNELVYWVALPALIIASLVKSNTIPSSAFPLIVIFLGSTLLFTLANTVITRLAGVSPRRRGTFLQATFRGNQAFIGIPVVLYAMNGRPQPEIDATLSLAVILFIPTMIFYNVASVVVLTPTGADGAGLWKNVRSSLVKILRNPLILSCFLGIILMLMPWSMPVAIADTLTYVGRIAGPVALLCVGGGMAYTPLSDHWQPALGAAVLKVAVLPLFVWAVAQLLSLGRNEMLVLLVFSAAPTAVASYVMAIKLEGDGPLAAGAIFLSTAISVISLGVVVAAFG